MEDSYQVRSATAADVPTLLGIERTVFADPWSGSAFRELLGPHSLVAVENGNVAGYVFARVIADEAEVLNLAVRKDLQRKGIGRYLLDAIFESFRKRGVKDVYLEVRVSNAAGQAFYERLGFRQVGRRRGYYDKPREDALILARPLGPNSGTEATP